MFTIESSRENRDRNKQVMQDVDSAHHEIVARKIDEIERRHEEIRSKIRSLQEEKGDLISGEITNEELVENIKKSLQSKRDEFVFEFIVPYFSNHKTLNTPPFSLRMPIPDLRLWEILLFSLSEEDIMKAVSRLPESGTPMKERVSRIKAIDKEIASLSKTITDELEAVKSQN